METFRRALLVAGLLAIAAPGARGQSAPLNPANAKPFLGVWVIEMTEPAVFKGTHTMRLAATRFAANRTPNFPAIEATGLHRDGNMLVLTLATMLSRTRCGEWHAHLVAAIHPGASIHASFRRASAGVRCVVFGTCGRRQSY